MKGSGKMPLTTDRVLLSHERTMLASVRAATTLMTFGFALFKFLEAQAELRGHSHLPDVVPPRAIGLIMLLTGLIGLVLAIIRHYKTIDLLKQYFASGLCNPGVDLYFDLRHTDPIITLR